MHMLCAFFTVSQQQDTHDNYIDVVFVPPNCTDQLQPLDLSFNKPVKNFMYAGKIIRMVFQSSATKL